MGGTWQWPPGWRKIRAEVFRVKGRQCWHCGRPAATVDHYPIPAALGGPSTLANLVPACGSCNSSRGASFGNRRRPRRPLSPRQLAAIKAKRAGAGTPAPVPRSSRDW
jgi:5-methylcytosine-specific restriction endonuclease McrA